MAPLILGLLKRALKPENTLNISLALAADASLSLKAAVI